MHRRLFTRGLTHLTHLRRFYHAWPDSAEGTGVGVVAVMYFRGCLVKGRKAVGS